MLAEALQHVCPQDSYWSDAAKLCVSKRKRRCEDEDREATVGNPCSASDGEKTQEETDYRGSGMFALDFTRRFGSKISMPSAFGQKWQTSVGSLAGSTLTYYGPPVSDPEHVIILRPDGATLAFRLTNGVWTGDPDIPQTLARTPTGWLLSGRDGTAERYSFTDSGQGQGAGFLTQVTNPAGLARTIGYDASNRVASVTNSFGHALTFGYDTNGRVQSLTDPVGSVIQYSYTGNNVSRVDYPDGTARIYHYEYTSVPDFLTGISDVATDGTVTRFSTYGYLNFDGLANLTQHADVGNGGPQEKFTLAYNTVTQTTVTNAIGTKEVMTFAENLGVKNLTQKKNLADNKTLTQTFDANNNRTCRKDEEGRVTQWSYNATNQKVSMTEGLTGTCPTGTTTPETRTTTYEYLSPTLDLPRFIRRPSVASGRTYETEIVYGDSRFPNLPTQIIQRGFTPAGNAVSRTLMMGYNGFGQVNLINGPRFPWDAGMNWRDDVTTMEYYECATGGACGQLKRAINGLGQITTYDSYFADGRLAQMADPTGMKTIYTYDARGRIKTMNRKTPAGANALTQYDYTPWGDVKRVEDPDGVALNYDYDAAHYLRKVTDAVGNYIEYGYDLKGNRTSEKTYDPQGALRRTVEQAYDHRNHLQTVNRAGDITQMVFDAVGNLTSETDPDNHTTTNAYDSLNRLFETVNALPGPNNKTTTGFDPNDRARQVNAPGTIATGYEYDDLGNLLKETSPDRGVTTYTHDAAGNIASITNARNQVIANSYDALNRLTFADAPATANDTTYTYDTCANGIGRLCSIANGFGTVTYGYNPRGRVVSHQGVSYTYSLAGRVKSMTYPSGAVVNYDRDTAGRAYQVRLTRNGVPQTLAAGIAYEPFGPVKALTYGNGKTLTQTLDQNYRIRAQQIPGVLALDYSQYDGVGNLKQRTDTLASSTANFAYDEAERLDTASGAFGNRDYDYDGNGNRTQLSSSSITGYGYAPNSNRLASIGGTGVILDPAGNLTGQGSKTYGYNALNRLVRAYESNVEKGYYTYNGLSQRLSKKANNVTTTFAYGLDGQLLTESRDGATPREYVYLDGSPLAILDPPTAGASAIPALVATTVPARKGQPLSFTWGGIVSPTYDDWVALYVPGSPDYSYLDYTYTNGASSGTGTLGTTDPTLVAGGTYELRFYANGSYTPIAKSPPFVLDPSGPVIQVTSAPQLLGQPVTFKWSGISTPTPTDWVGIYAPNTSDFAYLGYVYTTGQGSGTASFPLTSTALLAGSQYELQLYANDGYDMLARTSPFTVLTDPGQGTPARLHYVHTDHLGTPIAMTNEQGLPTWKTSYDPFGEATVFDDPDNDGQKVALNLRFAGQYYDQETGLHYNWHRYYDPRTGRYLSHDPLTVGELYNITASTFRSALNDPQNINAVVKGFDISGEQSKLIQEFIANPHNLEPYNYAFNNPLRYTDPTGESAFTGFGGLTGISGPQCEDNACQKACTAQFEKNKEGCRKLKNAKARALCWAAIMAKYATCLALCK